MIDYKTCEDYPDRCHKSGECWYRCTLNPRNTSSEDIIWALQHSNEGTLEEQAKASDILRLLSTHPKWSEFGLHRCPLCGYENDATNVHRHCPKAPIDPNVPKNIPEYLQHMAVPMYMVE